MKPLIAFDFVPLGPKKSNAIKDADEVLASLAITDRGDGAVAAVNYEQTRSGAGDMDTQISIPDNDSLTGLLTCLKGQHFVPQYCEREGEPEQIALVSQ
eukprot:gene20677-biopygen1715